MDFTFVLLYPEPCISNGWKKTVSPFSIGRYVFGQSSLNGIPWNALLTPPWNRKVKILLTEFFKPISFSNIFTTKNLDLKEIIYDIVDKFDEN